MATKVTDPALLAQLNGNTSAPAKVTDPALLAQLNGTVAAAPPVQDDPNLFNDLPIPKSQGGNFDPVANAPKPNQDSPLDALNTYGTHLAESIPIAGPTLQSMGQNFDAMVDNLIYRPITGNPGTTTTEDVAANNAHLTQSNPEAAMAGDISGPVVSYLLASRIPGGAQALGLEGPMLSRLLLGGASQYGINTADNLAHGQDIGQSLQNAVLPTAIAAPFSVFGKGPAKALTERDAAVNALESEGVSSLTAGQKTGSKTLKYMESELGGGKGQALMEQQAEQFTKAALAKAGINASRATPPVLDKALTDIGKEFDGLASRNTIVPDRQLGTELKTALSEYTDLVNPSQQSPLIGATVQDIADRITNNPKALDGAWYKTTRSRINTVARETSNPELKMTLFDIQGALDDAMERSIAKNNPGDLGAWKDVRGRYKNMLVIERAATGAGENAAMGLISPAALRQAAVGQGRRAYARGANSFSDLAHAGNAVLAPLPQSGTAPRTAVRNMMMGPSAIAGMLAGHDMGGIIGGAAGTLAGTALPAALGRALLSQGGRDVMSGGTAVNRALQSNLPAVTARALAQQLLGPSQ